MGNARKKSPLTEVLETFTHKDTIYSLEYANNLYVIRENGKTVQFATNKDDAEKKYLALKETMMEGGEEEMGNKKTEEVVEETLTALDGGKPNTELALPEDYFQQNLNVGLSGIGVEDTPVPTLSIVQSGSKMRDSEGRPYTPGKLYYKALKQDYDVVQASILVITKKMMPSYSNRDELERTFMVLGCIMPVMTPFMMFCKSSGYFSVRNFIGEVKALKKPMYSLDVHISTEKRQNEQGEWYVPVFTIAGVQKDPNVIVTLEELAKDYDMVRDTIKSEDEVQPQQQAQESTSVQTGDVIQPNIDPEEIPF